MNELVDFYREYCENDRLLQDNAHKIEWLTTLKYLEKYIPSDSSIFDCCAGTGRYSFWLAENGFSVTAGDLMQKHVEHMKADKRASLLKDIFLCDTRDMSQIRDNSYDVVMCMGAYYHLHDKNDRKKTVSECIRILKDNGILILAYINRNAVFLNQFNANPVEMLLESSVMLDGKNGVFYASEHNEIDCLIDELKLNKLANIGIDGSMYPLINEINSLDEQQFQKYLDYHFSTCEIQSILGNSMHGLYFAQRKR